MTENESIPVPERPTQEEAAKRRVPYPNLSDVP